MREAVCLGEPEPRGFATEGREFDSAAAFYPEFADPSRNQLQRRVCSDGVCVVLSRGAMIIGKKRVRKDITDIQRIILPHGNSIKLSRQQLRRG